ncbi:MAG: putative rane protein putative virulence factor [Actinomycetia bacterium]|nr:putative rane protein putative virulence factor [Actinomycetes bacterium]
MNGPAATSTTKSRSSWRDLLPKPQTPLVAEERPAAAAARMGAATFASRGIGLVRVWMITAVLGTTYLGNSYQATSSVSNVLFELLAAGALSAVLVPTFVELLDAGRQREAERLAAGLLGLAAVALGLISVVALFATPWLAHLLTTGAPAGSVARRQEALSAFFLYFFIPQVVLYAFGTVATGVLYAQRRFVITALAPIANTVVLVVAFGVFHLVHPGTGLDLSLNEKLLLAVTGTLGVVGFCGVPVVALLRSGFRLRAVVHRPDEPLRRLLSLSTWAVLQHMGIGILLAASIVMGNHVEGGVVAYQFAFVAFMAPYAILAQPVHTTILPLLAQDAAVRRFSEFAARVRWAFESLALLTLPVSAMMIALAEPAMRVIGGVRSTSGIDLLTAALATLALGLFPYSVFLLFARAFYALGDSRTPAIVALVTAAVGAAATVYGALAFRGTGVVAALGLGNTLAYVLGALVLGWLLERRLGESIVSRASWRPVILSVLLGLIGWLTVRSIGTRPVLVSLLESVVLGGLLGGLYLLGIRLTTRAPSAPGTVPPTVPDDVADAILDLDLDPDVAENP